mgnify:CR=1 FL=1
MTSSSDNNPGVVVYGRDGCVQCTATRRKLKAMGVAHDYKDVNIPETGREAEQVASSMGARQLPLVVAGDQAWAGYRPDRIERLRPPVIGASSRSLSPSRVRSMGMEVGYG